MKESKFRYIIGDSIKRLDKLFFRAGYLMNRKLLSSIMALCFGSMLVFAKNVTIKLEGDAQAEKSLSSNEKEYYRASLNDFKNNLLLCDEVNIRTDDVDARIRKLQESTQIDASVGKGSVNSALDSDKVSRMDLSLVFRMEKRGKFYKFTYDLQDNQLMSSIAADSSKEFELTVLGSELNLISLSVLKKLREKKYITNIPAEVELRLSNQNDSAENRAKLLAKRQRELSDLQNEIDGMGAGSSAAEALEIERQKNYKKAQLERLQLQYKMMEDDDKRAREEEERKRLLAEESAKLQEEDLKSFNEEIKKIEARRNEILKEASKSFTLKKRIEIIESLRADLNLLKSEMEATIDSIKSHYDELENAEILEVDERPLSKIEKGKDGQITEKAKKFRIQEKNEIKGKYSKLKSEARRKIYSDQSAVLEDYESRIQVQTAELCNSTYYFRSLDTREFYLNTHVGEFDGDSLNWTAETDFNVDDIPCIVSNVEFFDEVKFFSIKDEFLIGQRPATDNVEQFKAYGKAIDQADLLFRTSIPYIYSVLGVKISYSSGRYYLTFESFAIYKTEDNKTLYSVNAKRYDAIKKRVEKERLAEKERSDNENKRLLREQERKDREEERRIAREIEAEQVRERNERLAQSLAKCQCGRTGLFFDGGSASSKYFDGGSFSLNASAGGKTFFGGLYLDINPNSFKEEYFNETGFMVVNFGIDIGMAKCFYFIRPYGWIGIGGGIISSTEKSSTSSSSSSSSSNSGESNPYSTGCFNFQSKVGVDLLLGNLSVGGYYKLDYINKLGWSDVYGASIGFTLR